MDTGLVFGIIFAIIIIGLLLVFGMEQIVNIFCITNTAQTNKAVKDMENAVDNVFNLGQGSAMPFQVSIPRNARICFVDPDNPIRMNNWNPSTDPDMYRIIMYRINASRSNMWITYGCGTNRNEYRVSHLRVSENFCVGLGTEI